MTNFTFSKSVNFGCDPEFTHIIPALLDRVWDQDNRKDELLWSIGNIGSVYGDAFIKVAYEPPYENVATGELMPGRVRILPINPSFCLPVDENEVLTQRGWLKADELTTDDKVLSIDPETNQRIWADVEGINIFDWDGPVYDWQGKNFSATMTPDHRWMTKDYAGRNQMRRAEDLHSLSGAQLVLAGGEAANFPEIAKYDDAFVELVGWAVTEGWNDSGAVGIGQSTVHNPDFCTSIDGIAEFYREQGFRVTSYDRADGMRNWYFPVEIGRMVWEKTHANKGINPDFLVELTEAQAQLLYDTLLDADGDTRRIGGRERFYQSTWELMNSFQMLAMMLGKRSIAKMNVRESGKFGKLDGTVGVHQSHVAWTGHMDKTERHYKGRVWCPTTSTGTWVTRRVEGGDAQTQGMSKTMVYLTGNCFPEW